jgi:ribonuclease HI
VNIRIVDWIHVRLDNLNTHIMGDRSWRDRSSELNQSLVCEGLEEQNIHVIIATDWSMQDDVTAWSGAVWRDHKLIFQWSTARSGRSSSYRSESEAIGDAVVWIKENVTRDYRVAALTDSLSIVSRVDKNMMLSTWWNCFNDVKAHITFVYVPGHSSITYNENIDKLAKEATVFGDMVHEPDDVIKAFRSIVALTTTPAVLRSPAR